ncbi:MAG TPA: tetratricopeptide repeat protein [Aggregatilineales bacterium]|nr:tetratricopeptide repeat protein [Aggregatilineales bacterium]
MPQYDAFLSYARKDEAHADGTPADYTDPDDSFVKRLYDALTAAELKIWWDRAEMPARGKPFLDEVRDFIVGSDRLLLVVGPRSVLGGIDASGKAFAPSAYVIDEIHHALTHCKVINPILREGEYEQFPDFLPSGDVPDFRKDEHFDRALEQLIRQLKDEIAPLGTLHGVPPLPPYYIQRKEVFAELGQKVGLTVQATEAGKPLVITAASKPGVLLQGMGGLGKSTLAAALARDCTIQRQFPDGIVWLTVGRSPQITAVQESLGLTFGDRRENYTLEPEDNKRALAYLLREKRALIILDDLWEKAHADALVVHAPLCRFLLTTRQSKLVTQMGLTAAQEVKLETLTAAEAIRLIETRLGQAAPDQHTAFERIHELLEGHTLALTLAAGRIYEKGAAYAPEYVTALERRLSSDNPFFGLDELETDDKSLSVAVTLAESYDALSGAMQRRFRLLGIFAPDGTFDAKAAAAVWAEPVEDVPEYLRVLVGASLLSDAGNERYDHHALLRAHARARMRKEGEADGAFDRYADYVIVFSEQFSTLPPEEWGILEPDLSHVNEVGDELVNLTSKDDGELQRGLAFAMNARHYLVRRRQLRRLEWLEMGLKAVRQLATTHPDEINTYRRHEGMFLSDLGGAWTILGEKRTALKCFEQSLLIDHALGDPKNEAASLNNIGLVWDHLGEKGKALVFYEQALPLQHIVGDRDGEAATLNNIGMAWFALGERYKALNFFERALLLRLTVSDLGAEASILNNIGGVWDVLGEKQKALEYYERALSNLRVVGDRGVEATVITNIGRLWNDLGNKRRALDYYEQALPLRREVGDRRGETITLNNIALISFQNGELEPAANSFRQIISIVETMGVVAEEALFRFNLAAVLRALGNFPEAIAQVEQALALLRSRRLPQDAAGQTVEQMEAFLAEMHVQPKAQSDGWLRRLFGKRG